MVDLKRQRSTSGGKNFIERIKTPILSKTILTTEIMYEPQSNLEEKDNFRILKFDFSSRIDQSISTSMMFNISFCNNNVRPVKKNKLSFSSIEINKPLPVSLHSVL